MALGLRKTGVLYFRTLGVNDSYIWGYSGSSRQVQRIAHGEVTPTTMLDLAGSFLSTEIAADIQRGFIEKIQVFGSTILVSVTIDDVTVEGAGSDNQRWLIVSTDNGANWTASMRFGEQSDASYHDPTYAHDRSIVKLTRAIGDLAADSWLLGTYTEGAAGPEVTLYKSSNATTWTEVMRFNETVANTKHIHCVTQDPFTGKIHIGLGDSPGESGIIEWDGTTAFPTGANLTPANLVQQAGFSGSAGSGAKPISLAYTSTHIYWGNDNSEADTRGMFRATKDWATVERVVDDSLLTEAHNMWTVETLNGMLVCASQEPSPTSDQYSVLLGSEDGATWERLGRCLKAGASTTSTVPQGFAVHDNKLYMSINFPASKGLNHTAIFERAA